MITPYTLSDNTPAALPGNWQDADTAVWLNVEAPSQEELEQLNGLLGIPLSFLKDPLDMRERPRVEKEGDCVLVIISASHEDGPGHLPFGVLPVGIIVTPTRLVTVCKKSGLVQSHLDRKLRPTTANPRTMTALTLLMRVSAAYINHLNLMDGLTTEIEDSLMQSQRNQELVRLLHIEKTLIYFRTALKGNSVVLEKLAQADFLQFDRKGRDYLDDVIIECRQASDMAEIFSQILGSLGDAFGTVVSNNLNKVMKILTSLTIFFMIPPLITGLYGMNVTLPFADHPHAFAGLTVFSVLLCAATLYYFWKKDWM